MAKVLVVYHSLGGNTKKMAEAVAEGARGVDGTEVTVRTGLEAGIDDLLGCDAVALGSPDYFSYMAGGLKDFLDRTYKSSAPSAKRAPSQVIAGFFPSSAHSLTSTPRVSSTLRFCSKLIRSGSFSRLSSASVARTLAVCSSPLAIC